MTLQPKESVRYDIEATPTYVGGSLTMTIEQPDAVQLFLRFEYRTTLPTADDNSSDPDVRQTQEIVKSAYRESDIDTVRADPEIHARAQRARSFALTPRATIGMSFR